MDNGSCLAASLVEAAVRAAVQAGAPRRTVAAAAAAVTSMVMASHGGGDKMKVSSNEPAVTQRQMNKKMRKKERRKANRLLKKSTETADSARASAVMPSTDAERTADASLMEGVAMAVLHESPPREPPKKAMRMGDDIEDPLPLIPAFPSGDAPVSGGRGDTVVFDRDPEPVRYIIYDGTRDTRAGLYTQDDDGAYRTKYGARVELAIPKGHINNTVWRDLSGKRIDMAGLCVHNFPPSSGQQGGRSSHSPNK